MKGGPAFPSPGVALDALRQVRVGDCEGMSLRDFYAAQAMPVAMTDLMQQADEWGRTVTQTDREDFASRCWAWADAMLKTRGG